jgi:hypothetical protein
MIMAQTIRNRVAPQSWLVNGMVHGIGFTNK